MFDSRQKPAWTFECMLAFYSKLAFGLITLLLGICWIQGIWRSHSTVFLGSYFNVQQATLTSLSAVFVYLILVRNWKTKQKTSAYQEHCPFLIAFRGSISMHKTNLFNFALPVNLANIFYTVSCLQNRSSLWGLCAMPTGSTSGVEQTLEQTVLSRPVRDPRYFGWPLWNFWNLRSTYTLYATWIMKLVGM